MRARLLGRRFSLKYKISGCSLNRCLLVCLVLWRRAEFPSKWAQSSLENCLGSPMNMYCVEPIRSNSGLSLLGALAELKGPAGLDQNLTPKRRFSQWQNGVLQKIRRNLPHLGQTGR